MSAAAWQPLRVSHKTLEDYGIENVMMVEVRYHRCESRGPVGLDEPQECPFSSGILSGVVYGMVCSVVSVRLDHTFSVSDVSQVESLLRLGPAGSGRSRPDHANLTR